MRAVQYKTNSGEKDEDGLFGPVRSTISMNSVMSETTREAMVH